MRTNSTNDYYTLHFRLKKSGNREGRNIRRTRIESFSDGDVKTNHLNDCNCRDMTRRGLT